MVAEFLLVRGDGDGSRDTGTAQQAEPEQHIEPGWFQSALPRLPPAGAG